MREREREREREGKTEREVGMEEGPHTSGHGWRDTKRKLWHRLALLHDQDFAARKGQEVGEDLANGQQLDTELRRHGLHEVGHGCHGEARQGDEHSLGALVHRLADDVRFAGVVGRDDQTHLSGRGREEVPQPLEHLVLAEHVLGARACVYGLPACAPEEVGQQARIAPALCPRDLRVQVVAVEDL